MPAPCQAVVNDRALTAESPVWSAAEGALYWIDTWRDRVYRLHVASGKRDDWGVPSKLAAVGLRAGGGLVVAMKSGIAFLDTQTGAVEPIVNPEPGLDQHRLNDGKTDRRGRFWFGSMEESGTQPVGKLYRFAPDRTVAAMDDDYVLPNGPAWSPDDRLMYLADSRRSRIHVYDFDADSGSVRNRRVFATFPEGNGAPDGATVDAEGCLWSACASAGKIARYRPDGELDRIVELPVTRPTSVIFGGDDLKTLYITTAAARLDPETLAAQPLAGAILSLRTDVPGLPEPLFAG
jgi:L-arabinonolactonase